MARINVRTPLEPPLLRIEPFKGMNLSVTPTQIDQSQSPEMINMNIDERGALNKRTGYERVFQESLGPGQINGLYEYRKANGETYFLIAHGTKLYTQKGKEQPVMIYDKLLDQKVNFFTMNDMCYVMDGKDLLQYDGEKFSPIVPYVPTMSISRDPMGGGTMYEDFNLMGTEFKDSFSGNGVDVRYYLSLQDIDDDFIKVEVDGVEVPWFDESGQHAGKFWLNYEEGMVLFQEAPPKGTNNVVIRARKTKASFPERIKKCRFSVFYGGANDSRVFVAGNPEFPDCMWRSGLYDPSYWPENGFYKSKEKIMGFSKQYDSLVVERTGGKHQVTYEIDYEGNPSFPSKPINDSVGTIATESIQIIENNPVSLSRDGVYMLTSTNVRDERNVSHISANVDPWLMREQNLDKAVSIDFDKKYWLVVNGNAYILDYAQRSESSPFGEWIIYNNIHASCFIQIGEELIFGSSKEGLIYRFKKDNEINPYNDDGEPINAVWKSKYFTFGMDERRKMVSKVFYSLKPTSRGSVNIYYKSNKKSSELLKTTYVDTLDFRNIDFNRFTFLFSTFPLESMVKIKAKKITHFQLILENNNLDEGLGLLSLGIKYKFQSEVK
ncbi:hypothetical protein NST63_17945 [Heyndrickxia sp. FSL W8-0496]|uniref:hypothetical protein n=1 Tax=Heyndrickxia sp. FSL W8-0496 TaxID=2954702 RepID=UPI0030FBC281